MTWTYSGNPESSLRDRIRLRVGDTDERQPLVTDEELDAIIDMTNSVEEAEVETIEVILAHVARWVSASSGDIRIQRESIYQHYADMLERAKKRHDDRLALNVAPAWVSGSKEKKERLWAEDDAVKPLFVRTRRGMVNGRYRRSDPA